MSPVAIPSWNVRGVLPPVNPTLPTSSDRSPYPVTLIDFVTRFATSPERIAILQSFLNFRNALHGAGLTRGFQWINGSFVEHVELIGGRPPADIDLATFYYRPTGVASQQQLVNQSPLVFNAAHAKATYNVDVYFIELNGSYLEPLIERVTYWNSVWSHRRNHLWKGYLQLDLSPDEDTTTQAILTKIVDPGGQP
ncbi:MAG: hypothetical protein V1792_17310 [Pseudomonadota bacterium]